MKFIVEFEDTGIKSDDVETKKELRQFKRDVEYFSLFGFRKFFGRLSKIKVNNVEIIEEQ